MSGAKGGQVTRRGGEGREEMKGKVAGYTIKGRKEGREGGEEGRKGGKD